MSYRAFKRLLGETSLERKCRFLFGAGSLLLITVSFWWYAHQTEHLARDQTLATGRILVKQVGEQIILTACAEKQQPDAEPRKLSHLDPETGKPLADRRIEEALKEFRTQSEEQGSKDLQLYKYQILKPKSSTDYDREANKVLEQFANEEKNQYDQRVPDQPEIHYYGAIRASKSCLGCHQKTNPDVQEGSLLAVIKIKMPTDDIDAAVQYNRAWLISTALVTALLIMSGSYLIVRYVIVKPVKHLKEVSDAISAGELNVRSEIQTGDEFEDLSHAFNRMLRNLVSMQDRLRKVNTDLDRKVDELAQANLALYESNRLKSDFLATMSHELRTPLNSILGFSEVLLTGDGLSDKQQRWVGNIQSSGQRLLNLINDILDLAKIEAGKMQVRLEEFSIHDICEGLLNMFRPMAEKKNIELRGHVDPGIPVLRQDVVKLQQILSNLLSNAIKFTPEGGRVLLKVEADVDQVVLTVTDTGVGIAPEEQELVFEKFRQGGNPLTREHAGTGLGLSIVRELSKLLGGEVTLRSELGRGSTFTVRVPMQLSPEPRLEFDLADEGVDLSKAQRVDVRLYAGTAPPPDGKERSHSAG
jgi:signal transduction histidine kinase